MKYALIMLVALLAGCKSEGDTRVLQKFDHVCADKDREAIVEFTLQCIEKANPQSDEEPEDWIRECKYTATKLYCPSQVMVIHQVYQNGYWQTINEEVGSLN